VHGGDLVHQPVEHGRDPLHELRVEQAHAGHPPHVAPPALRAPARASSAGRGRSATPP
jgi:hypothetical protein